MSEFVSRSLRCPVCSTQFSIDVRVAGPVVGRDTDFRPRYKGPDALGTAVDMCPGCRFAAYGPTFGWEKSEEDDEAGLGLSWTGREPQPATVPADEAVESLRRWIRRGEHSQDLGLSEEEPTAAQKYMVAARCNEFIKEHDHAATFDLWLRASWCARLVGDLRTEQRCQREAIPRLTAALDEKQIADKDRPRATYLLAELSRRAGDFTRAVDIYGRVSELADPDDAEGKLLRGLAERQVTLASAKSSVNAVIRDDAGEEEDGG